MDDEVALSPIELAWLAYCSRPPEIKSCRVCGAELAISKIGGGEPTVYHCSETRPLQVESEDQEAAWDHYRRSEFVVRSHGDSRVVAVVEELRALRRLLGREADPSVGERYRPWGDGNGFYEYLGDDFFGPFCVEPAE